MKKNNAEHEFLGLLGRFFTEYLPVSMNASAHTVSSYKCAFRLLFQYLNEETEIDARHITFDILNFDLLTGFFDWLVNSRKNSRTTAKQRMGALSSFAEYAQCRNFEAGCVFRSSLARISKKSFRRVKGKPRSAFTRTELEILFSLPDTTEKLGWRDLVLLSVMYSSGARAQEICGLTVKDISHDEKGNAILTLRGKGEKSRRVKITFDATQLLNNYVVYRKIRDQPDRHIFPSQRNEHLSVPAIEEIFEKYITRAKTMHPDKFCNGPYTPHVMRHTTASHLIEAGVPLAVVKNILGHSSIQTTQIYVELSQQTVVSTPFKNAVFRRNEMSFFAGQHAGVYSLDYRTTCRLEARQVLIYQCILDLTGENDKYNHSKAAHLYPPFSYIPRSAKNYKIEPALTCRPFYGRMEQKMVFKKQPR